MKQIEKSMTKISKEQLSNKIVNAFLNDKLLELYQKNLQKNLMRQINLENYVKVKLKNQ